MSTRTLTSFNLVLATAIIVALVRIPRTATVSDLQFLLVCTGTFTIFFMVSLLARLGPAKALSRAIIYSCGTLFTAAGIAAIVHEILRL